VVISSSSNFGHKCVQPSDANTFFTADMATKFYQPPPQYSFREQAR
jgi:hypothetical protein